MKNLSGKMFFIAILLATMILATNTQANEFNLTADGNEKTLTVSCDEVQSFYKRKVVCEKDIGDYLVPLNIK
jgi:hypothetical protein